MGKKIPISSFSPDLNFDNKLMKIEHRSWKIIITDNALFFNNDKQRNCFIALRNLHPKGTNKEEEEEDRKENIRYFIKILIKIGTEKHIG